MFWIEICNDGSYVADGKEYPILTDGIVQRESRDGERSGNDWAKITLPFSIETEHGVFTWEVEVIEYLEREVTSLLGYRIAEHPDHVLLKEEVTFRIQDGWAYPKETTLDLQLQLTKMRLV